MLGEFVVLAQSLQCPECGSKRIWQTGLRYKASGSFWLLNTRIKIIGFSRSLVETSIKENEKA